MEKKITRQQLQNACWTSTGSRRGYFAAYCGEISHCGECNRRVRFLCKVKDKIAMLQQNIILRICKEDT